MNSKELKFLQLFEKLSKTEVFTDDAARNKLMKQFMDLDFSMAATVWDYLATVYEDKILKDEKISKILGQEFFKMFFEQSETKCAKLLTDEGAVRRAVYQYCSGASGDKPTGIVVELLLGAKVDKAEEFFKCLVKNEKIYYGKTVKSILERLFIELLKKNHQKLVLNKKVAAMLLTYIGKIKSEEKAMLEQRIKEIK